MNKILKDFLNTEVFKNIEEVNNILFVLIGGSRSFGIVDERTDYDIIIFIKGKINNLNNFYSRHFLIHDSGARLHWYLDNEKIVKIPKDNLGWSMAILNHTKESVWVKNEKEYKKIKKKSKEYFLNSFDFEVLREDSFLYKLRKIKKITREYYSKDIYRYLLAWYWIKYGEITKKQKEWLKKLKRMRWTQDFDIKYEKELIETLLELQESIEYVLSKKDDAN